MWQGAFLKVQLRPPGEEIKPLFINRKDQGTAIRCFLVQWLSLCKLVLVSDRRPGMIGATISNQIHSNTCFGQSGTDVPLIIHPAVKRIVSYHKRYDVFWNQIYVCICISKKYTPLDIRSIPCIKTYKVNQEVCSFYFLLMTPITIVWYNVENVIEK